MTNMIVTPVFGLIIVRVLRKGSDGYGGCHR
jgi:hypothetical protein